MRNSIHIEKHTRFSGQRQKDHVRKYNVTKEEEGRAQRDFNCIDVIRCIVYTDGL